MMGMSTHLIGFRPADAHKTKTMKAVLDACQDAGVDPPKEVEDFFNVKCPDPSGALVEIEKSVAVKRWRYEDAEGFEVDLTRLDPTVKVIRFYNSW